MNENLRTMVRLFSRPAMRHNPNSWLTVFKFVWSINEYNVMDVGLLPEWER